MSNTTDDQLKNWTALQTEYEAIRQVSVALIGKSMTEALAMYYDNTTVYSGRRLMYIGNPYPLLASITDLTERPWYSARDAGQISGVRDQGECGCCWAFGILAVAEATVTSKLKRQNPNAGAPDYSEADLVFCQAQQSCAGNAPGLNFSDAIELFHKVDNDGPGLILEKCVPEATYPPDPKSLPTTNEARENICRLIDQTPKLCPRLKRQFDIVEIPGVTSIAGVREVVGFWEGPFLDLYPEMQKWYYSLMLSRIRAHVRKWGAVVAGVDLKGPINDDQEVRNASKRLSMHGAA